MHYVSIPALCTVLEKVHSVDPPIQTRYTTNENLYVAFIDLLKCFDFIDRDMMLYKLSNWFSCKTGVKQGEFIPNFIFNIC
jgi:hypothetical protein